MDQDNFFQEMAMKIAKLMVQNENVVKNEINSNLVSYELSDISSVFFRGQKMTFQYIIIKVMDTTCLVHSDGKISVELPINTNNDYLNPDHIMNSMDDELASPDYDFDSDENEDYENRIMYVEDNNMLLVIASFLKW